MELKAKMSGSIDYLSKEKIKQRLNDIIDIIDGYGLVKILSDDDATDVHQEYVEQDVAGEKVQTVIGTNYRINLFENDDVNIVFSKKSASYEQITSYRQTLKDLGFKNRTSYKSIGYGTFHMKSSVEVGVDKNSEDIVKIFSLFEIE